jgi:hypothetical protein
MKGNIGNAREILIFDLNPGQATRFHQEELDFIINYDIKYRMGLK